MSIPNEGAPAPQVIDPSTVPAAPPAPAVAPAAPASAPSVEPAWLPERIAQAKRSAAAEALAAAGFDSPEAAKAAALAAKTAAEANKTAEQRAIDLKVEQETLKTKHDAQTAIVVEFAARQMMALTAEQQAAVKAIAGDDPGGQLKAITALQPTWGKPAPLAPPKAPDTAPGATAPADGTLSQPEPRQVYDTLKSTNPFAAAEFARANPSVYDVK